MAITAGPTGANLVELVAGCTTNGADEAAQRQAAVPAHADLLPVDLNFSTVGDRAKALFFRGCTFDSDVDLTGATVAGQLEVDDSEFAGKVILNHLEVKGGLLIRDYSTFHDNIDLAGATVAGQLEMADSHFERAVRLNSTTVGSNLEMDDSRFTGDVSLNGAQVKQLVLGRKATFGGKVDFSNATIGNNLEMNDSHLIGDVSLNRTQVKGSLFLGAKGTFDGDVDLELATVRGALDMEGSSFAGNLELGDAQIKGGLFLWDATVAGTDWSGAEIGELDLSGLGWRCPRPKSPAGATAEDKKAAPETPSPMHWSLGDPSWSKADCGSGAAAKPNIGLNNTHVGAFQDSPDAWPPVVHLEGFRYERLGRVNGEGSNNMHQRATREWTDWIARDPTFSTQPYTQLSSVKGAAQCLHNIDRALLRRCEHHRVNTGNVNAFGQTPRVAHHGNWRLD